jgi:RNA polymerase sigma-70 factor (ECF subfamily)
MSFEAVAAAIGKEPAACRQLASRARTHVREERPRFPVERVHGLRIAEAFFAASRNGQMANLRALLAADVKVVSDGGGKRPAAMEPIVGIDAVVALHEAMARLFARVGRTLIRYAMINGLPGFVTLEADGMVQTTALEMEDGRITAIYIVRNPDKLGHIEGATHQ